LNVRVLLKLRSLKDAVYDLHYYHKLQGFVYDTIRPRYQQLHELAGYKFFCFSNIFPIGDIREGDTRHLLVSSPDNVFIKAFVGGLDGVVNIGDLSFSVKDVKTVNPQLKGGCNLIAATPIVIRIPEYNYGRYSIPQEHRKRRYVFWRRVFPFEVFVRQLEENLFKKYNEFHNTKVDEFPLFEQFLLRKDPVACHTVIDGREIQLIGSIWEFPFHYLTREQGKILEFGLDCGFGERNSLGFGFMNKIKEKRAKMRDETKVC